MRCSPEGRKTQGQDQPADAAPAAGSAGNLARSSNSLGLPLLVNGKLGAARALSMLARSNALGQ